MRGNAKLGLRSHRNARRNIGVTKALCPDQFLISHDANGHTWRAFLEHLAFEPRGEEARGGSDLRVLGNWDA
jgi:hypothetical protein